MPNPWDRPATNVPPANKANPWERPAVQGNPLNPPPTQMIQPDARSEQMQQQAWEKMPWSDVPADAAKNIPQSMGQFASGIGQAVMHPIETASNLGKIVAGGVESLSDLAHDKTPEKDAFNNVVNFFGQRYGGLDNLKKTIASDPVGFLSDLSVVLSGAGATAKVSGLSRTGEVLKTASELTDPMAAAGKLVRSAGGAIPKELPQGLYAEALKPGFSRKLGGLEGMEKVIQTGLKEGIPVTRKGLQKTDRAIDEINTAVQSVIDEASKRGERVSVDDIAKRLESVKERFKTQVNPGEDLVQIDKVEENFKNHPDVVNGSLDVKVAQEMKQGTYRILRDKYGKLEAARVEAEKGVARGIREELLKRYPELQQLDREGKLIELNSALEKRIGRLMKSDVPFTRSIIEGAVVGAATGSMMTGAKAVLLDRLLNNSALKSKLAIALEKARKGSTKSLPAYGTKTRALFQAGRLPQSEDQSQIDSLVQGVQRMNQ